MKMPGRTKWPSSTGKAIALIEIQKNLEKGFKHNWNLPLPRVREREKKSFQKGKTLLTVLCCDTRLLAGYISWRQFCRLSKPRGLKSLAQVLKNHSLAKKFMQLYGTPKNIDIWIGALAEPFVKGGRVGPLMACLIGTQFRKIRDGDR